jgi:hypothetical protein
MGKKRKLDREIKITVSIEKLLNISKRKLKKAKREKHLIHKTVLIQNTIKLLKHIEVEHEILNHSPVKKTKCDKYDIVNFYFEPTIHDIMTPPLPMEYQTLSCLKLLFDTVCQSLATGHFFSRYTKQFRGGREVIWEGEYLWIGT